MRLNALADGALYVKLHLLAGMVFTVQRFEWLIGLRYLRAKRHNGFISFISLVSVLGITLGVAALIIVLSVMNGFQEEVRNRILGATSHVEISGYDNKLTHWQQVAQQIRSLPEVVASAPYVLGQALIHANEMSTGVMVRGILPLDENRVADFAAHMVYGRLSELVPDAFNIVLGDALARQLGVGIKDKVTLITPQGQVTVAGMLPRIKQFTVVGIFHMDAYQYDSGLALIAIEDAQKLYRLRESISGLRVKLTDLFQAPRIAHQMMQAMPDYLFTDWTQQNANYFRAVQIEKRMLFIILTLIIAVAAFNLVSTLVMVVTDKEADIAILRTLGAPAKSIMKIFIIQGALSGLIGTFFGIFLGTFTAVNIDIIIPALEKILGFHFLSAEVYEITELPSKVLLTDISTIGIISLLLSFIATIYPSWQAARVHPAQALRYE